jgi:hypothetical protein
MKKIAILTAISSTLLFGLYSCQTIKAQLTPVDTTAASTPKRDTTTRRPRKPYSRVDVSKEALAPARMQEKQQIAPAEQ